MDSTTGSSALERSTLEVLAAAQQLGRSSDNHTSALLLLSSKISSLQISGFKTLTAETQQNCAGAVCDALISSVETGVKRQLLAYRNSGCSPCGTTAWVGGESKPMILVQWKSVQSAIGVICAARAEDWQIDGTLHNLEKKMWEALMGPCQCSTGVEEAGPSNLGALNEENQQQRSELGLTHHLLKLQYWLILLSSLLAQLTHSLHGLSSPTRQLAGPALAVNNSTKCCPSEDNGGAKKEMLLCFVLWIVAGTMLQNPRMDDAVGWVLSCVGRQVGEDLDDFVVERLDGLPVGVNHVTNAFEVVTLVVQVASCHEACSTTLQPIMPAVAERAYQILECYQCSSYCAGFWQWSKSCDEWERCLMALTWSLIQQQAGLPNNEQGMQQPGGARRGDDDEIRCATQSTAPPTKPGKKYASLREYGIGNTLPNQDSQLQWIARVVGCYPCVGPLLQAMICIQSLPPTTQSSNGVKMKHVFDTFIMCFQHCPKVLLQVFMAMMRPEANNTMHVRVESLEAADSLISNITAPTPPTRQPQRPGHNADVGPPESSPPPPQSVAAAQAQLWGSQQLSDLFYTLKHDPSIKVRRAAVRVLSHVAVGPDSREAMDMMDVLRLKIQDKDPVVRMQALDLAVQLPAHMMNMVASFEEWCVLFKLGLHKIASGQSSRPSSFLRSFQQLMCGFLSLMDNPYEVLQRMELPLEHMEAYINSAVPP